MTKHWGPNSEHAPYVAERAQRGLGRERLCIGRPGLPCRLTIEYNPKPKALNVATASFGPPCPQGGLAQGAAERALAQRGLSKYVKIRQNTSKIRPKYVKIRQNTSKLCQNTSKIRQNT